MNEIVDPEFITIGRDAMSDTPFPLLIVMLESVQNKVNTWPTAPALIAGFALNVTAPFDPLTRMYGFVFGNDSFGADKELFPSM